MSNLQSNTKSSKVFYGWFIVLACLMVQGSCTGIFTNCNSVFMATVPGALGVGRGSFALYTTIGGLIGQGATMIYGELYRRRPDGFKIFMLASCFATSIAVFGYSISSKLWHFYAFSALFGCFMAPLAGLSITTLINNWFIEKRSLATGIAFTGSGITAAIMLPIVSKVVENYGWRWGYRLLAVSGFVLMFVSIVFFVCETPAKKGMMPYGYRQQADAEVGALPELAGLTRAQALKTPSFYLLALGFTLLGMVGMGISGHALSYLNEVGRSDVSAKVMSMVMVVMIAGKIILGAVFDKMGSVKASILTGFCMVISAVSLHFADLAPFMPWVFAVCFGFGYSTLTVPYSYLISEIFGTKEFSAVYSVVMTISGLGGAFANPLAGALRDFFGTYKVVWPIYMLFALASTLCMVASSVIARRGHYNPKALIQ